MPTPLFIADLMLPTYRLTGYPADLAVMHTLRLAINGVLEDVLKGHSVSIADGWTATMTIKRTGMTAHVELSLAAPEAPK